MKYPMSLQRRSQILWEMQKLVPDSQEIFPNSHKGLARAYLCCENTFDFDSYGTKLWIDSAWAEVCKKLGSNPVSQYYSFTHFIKMSKFKKNLFSVNPISDYGQKGMS